MGVGQHIVLEADGISTYQKDLATAEDFSGFGTVASNGSNTTSAEILAGTASEGRSLVASFGLASGSLVSDALTLSGSGDETFVLQLNYNESLAIANFGSEDVVRLGWLHGSSWELAVNGNSEGIANFVMGAWNDSYALGTYGLDTDANTVWAVVDHSGAFAAVPEPSSIFALFALMVIIGFRNRRFVNQILCALHRRFVLASAANLTTESEEKNAVLLPPKGSIFDFR